MNCIESFERDTEGKICAVCHGQDGKGLGEGIGSEGTRYRGTLPIRTGRPLEPDGELFWILRHGSPGTDLASFVPLILSEDEAWQVLLYVRSMNAGKKEGKKEKGRAALAARPSH